MTQREKTLSDASLPSLNICSACHVVCGQKVPPSTLKCTGFACFHKRRSQNALNSIFVFANSVLSVTGRVVSPCCLKQLMDDILFVMRTFSENHIVSELQEGTLLGAVKLGGVLPWERDADIAFLSANFSAILGLRDYFLYHGYSMLVTDPLERRSDGSVTGGTIRLQGARWPIELWGQHKLQSDAKMEQGNVPTRISLGGTAVPVPRNPGLFVRNRYGREVYKHAQHWMALGLHSSWAQYQPGYFTRCPQPGHHDCLDLHPADGNLQFSPP